MENLVNQLTTLVQTAQAALDEVNAQSSNSTVDPVRDAVQNVLLSEGWTAPADTAPAEPTV